MSLRRAGQGALALAVLVSVARSQNFNVDVGEPGSEPPPSYRAAGSNGFWNSVRADHVTPFTPDFTPQDVFLVDTLGNPTGVGFHQFGGMDLVTTSDPSLGGDDAAFLNDYLATHSLTLENCMYLNGLEDGTYEVLTYAWMPNSPGTLQNVRFDGVPGSTLVGGAWPGQHVEGVTFSRDVVEVIGGHLGWHVGIPGGGAAIPGAAFNGFQIRRLDADPVPALPAWGIIALGGLLAAFGLRVLGRRAPAAG